MREAAGHLIAEAEQFGCRLDGEVRDTTLTMPSGTTKTVAIPRASNAAVSGKAPPYTTLVNDTVNDVYLKNYAILSWKIGSGSIDSKLYGQALPGNGAPFIAPSGRVWFLQELSGQNVTLSSWQFTAKRLMVIGESATLDEHTVTVANPVYGNADYPVGTAVMHDVTPDGARRIHRIGDPAIGWVELVVSEVSATEIAVAASLVRDMSQTAGSYTETPHTITPHGTSGYVRSGSVSFVQTDDGSSTGVEKWDVSLDVSPFFEPPTDGAASYSETFEQKLIGHIFGMTYNSAGALDELLLDVELSGLAQVSSPTISSASGGPQTVNWDADVAAPHAVTGPSMDQQVTTTISSTESGQIVHRFRRAGGTVATISNAYSKSISYVATDHFRLNPTGSVGASGTPGFVWTSTRDLDYTDVVTHDWHGVGNYIKSYPITYAGSAVVLDDDGATSVYHRIQISSPVSAARISQVTPDTSDPWKGMLYQVFIVAGGARSDESEHYCHIQPYLRTNTIATAPGAVRAGDSSATVYSWDSIVVGRNGVIDNTPSSVTAIFTASPNRATWSLPYISEHPISGDVLRGSTSAEQVGWI